MSTFTNFAIRHEYASLAARGDRLGEISDLIDWDAFRPLLADLYTNAEGRGGRPNYDVVLMIKLLVLQQWYGLSDPELERQATDRISFRHFLGYPETIPDRSTVWLFRERLAKTGKDPAIWEEFQRQLDEQGLTIKRGVMQDASFITRRSWARLCRHTPGRGGTDAAQPRRHLGEEGVEIPLRLQTPYPHGQRVPAHPPDRDHYRVAP